jgi:hypothetical protein
MLSNPSTPGMDLLCGCVRALGTAPLFRLAAIRIV